VTCEKCAAREKTETRERESCQQERKRLDVQSKRLTIMLTVVSTIVGKEVLDEAMSIFNTVGEVVQVADAKPATSPVFNRTTPDNLTLLTSLTLPDSWEPMPNSYLPGYQAPNMTLFQEATLLPESPSLFLALLALQPNRKRK
jgi:predicted metalloprotease